MKPQTRKAALASGMNPPALARLSEDVLRKHLGRVEQHIKTFVGDPKRESDRRFWIVQRDELRAAIDYRASQPQEVV